MLKGVGFAAEAFAAGPLAFASPSHFVMSCGNALRFVPAQRDSDGADAKRVGENVEWCEGASIGALDASPGHGIVAYGERQRSVKDPRIFVYSADEQAMKSTMSCEGELGIVALALCKDPRQTRLVALGEIPEHCITVWDWGLGSLLAKVSAQGSRARSVSFDPLDSNMIASMGSKLELWTLTEESGAARLHAYPVINIDKEERAFTAHCWAPNKTLFVASDSGEICHVNARTGCKMYGTGWTKVSSGPIGALALSSKHVLAGGSEGSQGAIHWISYPQEAAAPGSPGGAYTVEKSTPKVDGPVTCLSMSPDFATLVVATAQGTVACCSLLDAVGEDGEERVFQDIVAHEVGHGFPDGGINSMVSMSQMPVVCTAGQRGSITLWMVPSLQIISTIVISPDHEATCMALADDSHVIVAGSTGGEVTAVDISSLADPRLVFRARLHSSRVTAVSVAKQWIASAALAADEPYIVLSKMQSSEGSASVMPVGRVMYTKSRLLHMQLTGNMMLATTSEGELLRMTLPAPSAPPSLEPLTLQEDTVKLSGSVSFFTLEMGSDESSVKLVGWCADRGLRCWKVSLEGTLSAELVSEWKGSVSQGTVVAAGSDLRGNAIVLAGARDGSITLRNQASLGAKAPSVIRHIGAAAAVKGGLSAEPSANLQYEPMVVGRGGVSGVAIGAGALRGWVVSAGRDGSLIAQALEESLPPPLPSLPPPVSGLLAAAPLLTPTGGSLDVSLEAPAVAPQVLWDEWKATGGAPMGAAVADGAGAERGEAVQKIGGQLAELKETFERMLEHNKTCPDIEKLDRNELTIDLAEKARMVALADSQARHVSMTIQRENALRELRAKKIKESCNDSMDTALLALVPLDSTAPLGLKIRSYPVAKLSEAEEARLKRIRFMRRLEMQEQALSRDHGLPTNTAAGPDGLRMSHAEMQRVMAEHGGKSAPTAVGGGTALTKDEDGDEEAEVEVEAGVAVVKKSGDELLLYDALALSTREQRLNQIELQRNRIRGFKGNFNEKLKGSIKDKSSVIDKLDEKKSRLAEIKEACALFLFATTSAEKLQVDDRYVLAPSEEEGSQLKVSDAEITAPKYLSATERAAKEAEEAEERARQAAAGSDDAVGRALNDMMFGTLEARKQDDHNIFEDQPVFFDTPIEQLNDDQIKMIREYEKKLKNAAEEEDKQRKTMEAEAKKIKTDMQLLITEFHVRLADLSDHKVHHTATHRNTLQHTATHCNTLQHTATRCDTLRHTASHRNTPQHTATHCNSVICETT